MKKTLLSFIFASAFCLLTSYMAFAQTVVKTYTFTGTQQIFVVPIPILGIDSIQIDVRGAQGTSLYSNGGWNNGGNGGRVYGSVHVIPGETLYVYVGGKNGYNGGGNGSGGGGNGGGASDIRIGGNALNNRFLIAGGGGGGGGNGIGNGGGGGGLIGGIDVNGSGGGGTQSYGGSGNQILYCGSGYAQSGGLGYGGNGANGGTCGAGGGGYYGGGGGGIYSSACLGIGGGGGSSLVPNGCTTSSSFQNGDGMIIISVDTCSASVYKASITKTNVSCYGSNNGSATALPTGGTPPYAYLWSNGQTTQTATGLIAGNYSVTVTCAIGCTRTASVTIAQPSSALTTVTVTNTPAGCNPPNGTATANTSGGVPPYFYLWSDGQTTQTATGFAAGGNYNVVITDSWGCSITGYTTMPAPSVPAVYISSVAPAKCYGACNGTAGGYALGGTPPYHYQWSTVPVQTTATATGLCMGIYNLSVVDNWGCVNTNNATATIQQPAQLALSFFVSPATCGNSNGSISANTTGGITPYTYSWSNGKTTQTVTGLSHGNYSLTITDHNGCTSTQSDSVPITTASNPICLVTVDSTSTKNVLVWKKLSATNISSYRIYRDISSVFTQIGSVPYSSLSTFTDITNGVNPNITSYQYKISVVDTCGNESALSSFHKTIHVAVSPATPCGYNLFWNDYIGFPVSKYRILRDTTGNYNWVVKDSVSFGNTSWTDNSCNLPPNTVYLVEVIVPSGGCTPTLINPKNPEIEAATINTTRSNTFRTNGNPTAANEMSLENSISVYPNPSNGNSTLDLKNINSKNVQVRMYDVFGRLVYEKTFTEKKTEINCNLAKGIYQLQVQTDVGSVSRKIIIQ